MKMPLVGTKEMFKKAYEGGYAIGAFNVNNMEIVQGITEAAAALQSPIILQCSAGARKYAKHEYLVHLVKAALEVSDIPIALHLDHGADFETCKSCIDGGFTSVMIDGSHHPFEKNIEVTKKVVEYAHERGVVVEAELGQLAGIEDDVNVSAENASYTQPEEVQEFVEKTGVDSLAIAIGTSHGAFKFKPEQCTRNADGVLVPPELRFDILAEIEKKIPNFPIVLHGASSVIPKYVKIINANGGKLDDAVGIPEDQLRKAAKSAVCKINIDSDLRLAMTAGIREHFCAHPEHFDPRQYITDGRAYIKDLVEHKIKEVLGSDGKAPEIMALLK
jgi:fructose-bisphosphate aldolase class II